MKKENNFIGIRLGVFIIFLVLFEYFLDLILSYIWLKSSKLFFYFLVVLYEDTFWYIIFVFLFIKYIELTDDSFRLFKKNRNTITGSLWKKGYKKIIIGVWGIVFVFALISNLLKTSNAYSAVKVNNKEISKIEYKIRIIEDVFGDSIIKEKFETENIDLRWSKMKVGGSASLYSHGSLDFNYLYIDYRNQFVSYSSYILSKNLFLYIYENKANGKNSFVIEYYKNSGVIKSIDGYTD